MPGPPLYGPCCCNEKAPVADFTIDCLDTALSLGTIEHTVPNGLCPTGGYHLVTSKIICFNLKPSDVLNSLNLSFTLRLTNNDSCAWKAQCEVDKNTEYEDPCDACFLSDTTAGQEYLIESKCQEDCYYSFTLSSLSAAVCCKFQLRIWLKLTCCVGTGLRLCNSTTTDQTFSKTIASGADMDNAWHAFTGGTSVGLNLCTGNICDRNTHGGRYKVEFINNVATCLECLVRFNNIVQPTGCGNYYRVITSDNCFAYRNMISVGPGGAYYYFCFAGTGTLDTHTLLVLDTIDDCCSAPGLTFDIEYKIRCVDVDNMGFPCNTLLNPGSCPLCGGAPPMMSATTPQRLIVGYGSPEGDTETPSSEAGGLPPPPGPGSISH